MCDVRVERLNLVSRRLYESDVPQFALYKGQIQTYPYPSQVPGGDFETRSYQAVVLENEYLIVTVLPELGGRVYSVLDKVSRQELFYKNPEISFQLIAPRGAWFAGGIEFNFPVGHALHTSSPVDYEIIRTDERVSVILSGCDRVSRMKWAVTLSLAEGEAVLRQDVLLTNPTPMKQPFYYWCNAAVPVTKETIFLYPTCRVYSDEYPGILGWPIHGEIDLRSYLNVNRPSSFFAIDPAADYFGVFYPERSLGVLHLGSRVDLSGMKLFTWGNNGDGRTWYGLLCADGSPYAEIQSGLPRDQRERALFPPYSELRFTEWWLPIRDLRIKVDSVVTKAFGDIQLTGIESLARCVSSEEEISIPQRATVHGGRDVWTSYVRAFELETQYRYREAERMLSDILDDNPSFALARVALARVRMKQGHDKDKVEPVLIPVLAWLPRYEPTRMEAAYLLGVAKQSDGDEVCLPYLSELTLSPETKSATRILYAESLIHSGKKEQARAILQQWLSDGNLSETAASRARILLWRLSNHDPNILFDHSKRGIVDTDRAEIELEQSLFNLSTSPEVHILAKKDRLLSIACDYVKLRMYDQFLEFIAPHCPPSVPFLYLLAEALSQMGRTGEANAVLAKVPITGNDFPWEKEVVRAIENAAARCASQRRGRSRHYYWFGHFLEAVGRYEDALAAYQTVPGAGDIHEEALSDEESVRLYHRMAAVYEKLGDLSAAAYYAQRAVEVLAGTPQSPDVLIDLDRILAHSRQNAVRAKLFDIAGAVASPDFLLRKMDFLLESGEYTQALRLMEMHTFEFSEGQFWPRAYYVKTYVLAAIDAFRKGQFEEAVALLKKARNFPQWFGIGESLGLNHFEQLDYLIGLVLLHQGDDKAAAIWFESAAQGTAPVDSELYYYRIAANLRLGRFSEAERLMDEWEHSLNWGTHPRAKQHLLRGLLALLRGKPSARDDIAVALRDERTTKQSWSYALQKMDELIPENRLPVAIWEAYLLDLDMITRRG